MKRKHIIALAVAVAFIAVGAYSLVDNKIDIQIGPRITDRRARGDAHIAVPFYIERLAEHRLRRRFVLQRRKLDLLVKDGTRYAADRDHKDRHN